MRCLWLTREAPYPPRYGGDYLYSSHVIEALAAAGASVTVLCYGGGGVSPSVQCREPGVEWEVLPAPPPRAAWRSLPGRLPSIAHRYVSAAMQDRVRGRLRGERWDAVLLDHIGMGWTLPVLRAEGVGAPAGPLLVYVSHNHEESVRRQVALRAAGALPKRLALRVDAAKVRPLERALVRSSGLLVANTEEDAALFRHEVPTQRYVVVSPGYDGPVLEPRAPAAAPRRAIVVGSFGWLAKQHNLEAFLAASVPRFQAMGVEIEVAGSMPPAFAISIRQRYPTVRVTTPVEDMTPRLLEARIGVVPEEVGGGFKHKALQYVFCRLPVAALSGSVAGTPLVPDESILEYPSMEALADGVLRVIDDPALLRRLDAAAFEACAGRFEWADRGVTLLDAMREAAS